MAKWLGEVKYFFANSGTEVSDPAMHFGATSHVYHQKATLNSVGGKMNIDAATGVTPVAPRERRPSALPNFNRRPSGVNLSSGAPNAAAATKPRVGAAASLLLVPGAAGTSAKSSSARNSVIGGNPKIFNPYAKYQPQPDDILEGITVHYVVQLIAIVGYYSEEIRVSAIRLLFRLSLVFDTKLEEHSRMLDEIILSIQTDDRGKHTIYIAFHYSCF